MPVQFLLDSSSIVDFLVSGTDLDLDMFATLDLAFYEVPNVLRRLYVTGQVSCTDAATILRAFVAMPVGRVFTFPDLRPEEIFNWSVSANLTFYDSAFVACAADFNLTLVTEDTRLARSAGGSVKILNLAGVK